MDLETSDASGSRGVKRLEVHCEPPNADLQQSTLARRHEDKRAKLRLCRTLDISSAETGLFPQKRTL